MYFNFRKSSQWVKKSQSHKKSGKSVLAEQTAKAKILNQESCRSWQKAYVTAA